MKRVEFYQVDVFTNTPFLGNPVAVVHDGDELEADEMQQIAREMNQAEAVFVIKATDEQACFGARFFTPTREVPFAGHSLLGTAFAMAEREGGEGPHHLRIQCKRRSVPVEVERISEHLARATMDLASPEFLYEVKEIPEIALALGLSGGSLGREGAPLQVVSAGLPQLLIAVSGKEALQRINPDSAALGEICREVGADCVYAFAFESADAPLEARLFAPLLGVPEDPVTGSAAGALGAYLYRHGLIGGEEVTIEVRQGSCVNRPGSARVVVRPKGEGLAVSVSGEVVRCAEGTMFF